MHVRLCRPRVIPDPTATKHTDHSSRSSPFAMLAIRRASAVFRTAAPLSTWSAVPAGPPDPILGLYDSPSCSVHVFTFFRQVSRRLSKPTRIYARLTWVSAHTGTKMANHMSSTPSTRFLFICCHTWSQLTPRQLSRRTTGGRQNSPC